MAAEDRTEELLTEILETQRAHLDEYRRAAAQSLEIQRQSVEAQARHIRLYRGAVLIGAILILALLVYIVWLSRIFI